MRMTFRSIRAVLIDLSGTIHVDDTVINGSIQALERLRGSNLHVKFVTNTTKESKRVLLERLNKLGFAVSTNEVFTSLTAARKLIDSRNLSPYMLIDNKALEEFKGVPNDRYDSVLIGLAPDKFNYDCLNKAFRLVLEGVPLIAIHMGRYYKTKAGLALGPGPFVAALTHAAGCKAEVVGKPMKSFFLTSIEEFDVSAEECVMIGDDARDDVIGAINAGMKGILVQTGKYRDGDEQLLPPEATSVKNFSDAVALVMKDCRNENTKR